MSAASWLQLAAVAAAVLVTAPFLGRYMAAVYGGGKAFGDRVFLPVERVIYRVSGVDPQKEQRWTVYAFSLLAFSLVSFLALYLLLRVQGVLPVNPTDMAGVPENVAFNTAVSFMTNTNWQSYAGEATMSHLSQMVGLTVQNFVSASAGMAVMAALIRGLARRRATTLGNFWVDLTRGVVRILLPLSFVVAIVLISQGVIQNFEGFRIAETLQGGVQAIPGGPAASQVAIKQLGTNGGGYFNANSAHPFENPTPWSNFLELLAILLLPAALCLTFGRMIGDLRQGWALLAAMTVLFVALLLPAVAAEQAGNPRLAALGVDDVAGEQQAGGNMEGKETRFGIGSSALWATATTAASNGSVNAMHDAFTPLGGLVPLFLMLLGEVVFGGVGSGLYGLLVFAILAVFIAGQMVGRTPEYLGKKIEAREVQMASLVILLPAITVLLSTALAVSTAAGRAGIFNPGPHGFSEVLYAFASTGNNNGSAFGGLGANSPFYNLLGGFAMVVGRFAVMVPVLAIAGSLAAKKTVPVSAGTLPTHRPLFVVLLVGTVLIVGALTFIPALALGPIVEHLQLWGIGS